MNLAIILFLGGAVVIAWIYFWARQQEGHEETFDFEGFVRDVPMASGSDAVLVSQEHGKLVYANESARRWLGVNGGIPRLEQVARSAEPADNFLQLLSKEGQSSFQLGRRWVEASSHRIPAGPDIRTVIVMRELTSGSSGAETLDMNLAMSLINEIGETINASMGMQQVLPAILSMLQRTIAYDAGEICLWDEEEQILQQSGWVGDSAYLIALAEKGGVYQLGEGISGWIARYHQPVLIQDVNDTASIQPKLTENNPYMSYVGVPLKLGDQFIGTLELASLKPNGFSSGDLALLQAINKSIAVMIYNTSIYGQQVQRLDDLASLQSVLESGDQSPQAATVYAALNQRVAGLLSADMCGIFLYDPDREGLVAMPPFHGLPETLIRGLYIPMPADSPQRDIWQHQSYWVSNDVADEPLVEALGLMPLVSVSGITNSAWFPLQISNQRIGVIAVSNKRTEGGFTARDLQHLGVLASQAAIVIENLRLYQREQRMDTELVGLQELTNAIGALSHETEFYGEITERIAHLMEIQMCGILLYDEDRQRLVSQLPFYGVSDDLISDYAIELTPGSVMEQLWDEEQYWYSNRVQTDSLVYEAGLDTLADKIGVEKTLIGVLQAGGRKLGVVQVSNKLNGLDFDDGDARLLMIFATQTAAIIQNARLYREARHSADQAQGLRRVAELAGNVLTTQESFAPVLVEISGLTNSEIVFVNVLNQQTGSLITYPRWVFGMELSEPIVQDIYSEGFEHSPVMSHRPYMGNDIANDERVLPSYKQVAARMNINKAILVPLVFGDRVLGELGVANRPDGEYVREDLEVMKVIAAQTAAALDRLLLYEATGQNLNRRLEELDAISRVSNELTTTLSLEQVLEVIREEAAKATRATDCTVVMLKAPTEWRNPDEPEMERRLGPGQESEMAGIEVKAVKHDMENVMIRDYDDSPLVPVPENARSAVAAAITYLDQVVGILHLYHDEPNFFDDQAVAFLMTLAVKASLGYANASRYQEQVERSETLRRRVDQLNRIFEFGQVLQGNTDPETILESIAFSVQQSVGFDTVLMVLHDPDRDLFHRVAQAGLPIASFEETRTDTISHEAVQKLLREDFRISESYFFPIEKVASWYVTEDINALGTSFDGKRSINARGKQWWHDGDMLLVPLQGATGQLLGVMSLDRPFDNRRPEQSTVEVLEIFARQAATTIENARLYQESLRNAEQEAQLNELAEAVASTLDVQDIVTSVAEGARGLVYFDQMTVTIVDAEKQGFEVLRLVPVGDELDVTREQQQTLGQSVMQAVYDDRRDRVFRAGDERVNLYEDLRDWHEKGEHVSLILPLLTGGEILGAMHIGSNSADASGVFEEFRTLLRRMAQMVASAIQNARLFDQAVSLQVLNRSVVESIQQGIVVLDNSGRIISVNEFMNNRYGWTGDIAGQDLFKYRSELEEFLKDDLHKVLEEGEPRERINQTLTDNQGNAVISNFYLYPLRYGAAVRGAVVLVEDVTARAKLEQAIQARAEQLAALTDVSTRVTSSLERGDVIELALEVMGELIPYQAMSLWRRNGAFMVLEGCGGDVDLPGENEDVRFQFAENELTQQIVETRRAASVSSPNDTTADIPLHRNIVSWMGVPLVNQGYVVGMMMLSGNEEGMYESPSDQNIAMAFASQVAIAQANAELFEQTFDRTNELETLLEAAQATSLTTDLESVYQTVVNLMFGALNVDKCAIMIWDEVDHNLEVKIDASRADDTLGVMAPGTLFDLSKSPGKLRSLQGRDVVVITTADENTPFPEEIETLKPYGDGSRMLVALVVRERAIGLIQLDWIGKSIVTQQLVRIARGLGSQVAVAIENARLSAETAAHFEESMVINELSHAIASTLELEDMVEIVCKQVPRVTNAREMYVALYDEAKDEIVFPQAVKDGQPYEIPPRKLGDDEVSFIIKHRRPLSIGADYFSPDELRKSLGIKNGEGDARSYLGVPLMAGDEVYGVLAVRDTVRTRAFTVNEQRILNIIGPQLGAAIQNARLFEQVSSFADDLNRQVAERTRELEDERDRIDTLYQITSELARTLDMDRLMPRALGMVAKAVNAHDGVIIQLDPITDQLHSRAVLNPDGGQDGDSLYHHPGEWVARWLIEEDENVQIVEDLHEEEYWDKDAPEMAEWRSALAVMLETNEELLGVMVLLSREPGAFGESHLRLLVAAANQVASSINNAELYKLIRDQAERLGSLLRAEQEEAEKNKAILEGIADGVVLSGSDDRIILFNTAAERILQIPRDQAMGQSLREITGIYSGSAATWAEILEQQMEDMGDRGRDFIDERIEMNGRNVSVHLSPVYTGDKFLGTVSVFRDITREVEADRSKSEFISNVSHEFRTPLTPIKGYIDMVLMGATGEVNDAQKNVLDTVKRNVDRLAVLVDDVLRISELDRGARELLIADVNLDMIIEGILDDLLARQRHKNKDLEVVFEPAEPASIIRADQEKIRQALNNIIDNALSYTLNGGSVSIKIEPDAERGNILITVADTGVGIPEDFHDKIWNRFERHDDTALSLDVAGTGLGMPIVKELVELHSGEIWFTSEVGVGTTFYISLPTRQLEMVSTANGSESDDRSN